MNDQLLAHMKKFLGTHCSGDKPLLLGLSGGPDSLALLYLLVDCPAVNLHIAHIDHGWRPESRAEALQLAKLAEDLKLPFHLHTLEIPKGNSNLEADAREARLKFFSKVYQEIGSQALLLAHQADDQAETVLKRILEGSHLIHLPGIKSIGELQGMRVLRPLLSRRKKELEEWLNAKGLRGFQDLTNLDPRFLRGRMRTEILPELASSFGKEVSMNLVRLGRTLEEVSSELEKEVQPKLDQAKRGPLGVYLEIVDASTGLFRRLKNEILIKKFLEGEGVVLSHESFDTLVEQLQEGAANKTFLSNGRRLIVDRGILFIIEESLSWGDLVWEVSRIKPEKAWPASSWRDLWMGTGSAFLPDHEYEIIPPETHLSFPGSSPIKEWWQENRVPAFLRMLGPLLVKDGQIVHEFLSGRTKQLENCNSLLQLSLKLKIK